MNLLTLNTLSNEKIETKEEVNQLLQELIYGIKKFLCYEEYKGSRFYTEEKNISEFEIITGYKFSDAIKSLRAELLSFFLEFLTMKCDNDCLSKITDEELLNILDGDLYFEDEGFNGQDYTILSYCLEKRTFLLSFGKDKWINYKIIASKMKESGHSEKVILDNIANKTHAIDHYNEKQLDKLPKNNIFYSQKFKDKFLSTDYSTVRTKIIEKIKEAEKTNFMIDGFLIKSIEDDIWQIKIGTMGGLHKSAVRALFKLDSGNVYIVHIFTKQGGNEHDYNADIDTAKTNYISLIKELKQ